MTIEQRQAAAELLAIADRLGNPDDPARYLLRLALHELDRLDQERANFVAANAGLGLKLAALQAAIDAYLDVLCDYRRKAHDDHPGNVYWSERFCRVTDGLAAVVGRSERT